jgi:hypothetical protein
LISLWKTAHFGFKGQSFRIGDRVIHRAGQGSGRPPVFRLGTVVASSDAERPGQWVGGGGSVRVLFDGDERPTVIVTGMRVSATRSRLRRLPGEVRP